MLGNPIHHRVVPTVDALCSYPWSGLGEILGLREPRWVDPAAALAAVHPDPGRACETLLDVLERKAREWAGDDRDPEAVTPTIDERLRPRTPTLNDAVVPPAPFDRPIDGLRRQLRREGWTPDRLVVAACALTGALPDGVRSGARTRPEAAARALVAFVACDVAGWSMVETARDLGVRPTALGYARRQGRARISEIGVSPERVLRASRDGAAESAM